MGQSRETVREVTVPAGGKLRVWDAPISVPIQDLHIWATTRGAEIVGALDWEVFYGGGWTASPFGEQDNDTVISTHQGGLTQGNGTFAAGAEIVDRFYTNAAHLPANRVQPVPPQPFNRPGGFLIVVELDNGGIVDIPIVITFLSKVVSDRY